MRAVILLSTVCLTGFRRHRRRAATTRAAKAEARRAAATCAPEARRAGRSQRQAHSRGTWAMENTVKTAAGNDTVVTSLLTPLRCERLGDPPRGPRRDPNSGGRDGRRQRRHRGRAIPERRAPGQTVTTRETLHFKDDAAWGTIEARYSNGEVVKGTVKGTRRK